MTARGAYSRQAPEMERPTGPQLVTELRIAAAAAKVGLYDFLTPLGVHPYNFLRNLQLAVQPKPVTVARVRALIDGRDIPPAEPSPLKGRAVTDRARVTDGDTMLKSDEIERRRALAETAAAERRPGETLQDAMQRIAGGEG